jgi:transcriptional regulator with XRE-family HTH domain
MTKRIYQPQISAERIKLRRKELNMTQKELAEKAHISVSGLKKYEGAERVPQEDIKKSLADALGVYEDWIVGDTDCKNIEDIAKHFADSLGGIFDNEMKTYESFMSFVESLGYSFDIGNDYTIITGNGCSKKLTPAATNRFFAYVINIVKNCIDDVMESEPQEFDTENKPYIQIINGKQKKDNEKNYKDYDIRKLYKEYRDKKEGDAE